jgi:hypothetical protein
MSITPSLSKIIYGEEQNLVTIIHGSEYLAFKKENLQGFHISMTTPGSLYLKLHTRDDTIMFPLVDDRETVRQIIESLKKILLTPVNSTVQNVSINF